MFNTSFRAQVSAAKASNASRALQVLLLPPPRQALPPSQSPHHRSSGPTAQVESTRGKDDHALNFSRQNGGAGMFGEVGSVANGTRAPVSDAQEEARG